MQPVQPLERSVKQESLDILFVENGIKSVDAAHYLRECFQAGDGLNALALLVIDLTFVVQSKQGEKSGERTVWHGRCTENVHCYAVE